MSSAQSYFDLAGTFTVGDHYNFRLGVNNILDKDPPLFTELGRFVRGGVLQRQHLSGRLGRAGPLYLRGCDSELLIAGNGTELGAVTKVAAPFFLRCAPCKLRNRWP